jgi:adenylate kinase family enzyme
MERINIIGSAGSGKSTLADSLSRSLAARSTACPVIELDALFWREGWQQTPLEEFRALVADKLGAGRWIVCGNYSTVRDITWQRADAVIWLDYGLPLVFRRLLRRTIQRIITQEELWGGNRETWRAQFLSRDSLLLYVLKTHHRRRAVTAAQFKAYPHLAVLRFDHPNATARWLNSYDICPT